MSGNVKFDKWVNDDNSENYKCRAWVNFNGTGTVAIRASGGVSSITDNGTGNYTMNFTTAMPDVNYCVDLSANDVGTAGQTDNYAYGTWLRGTNNAAYTTSSLRIGLGYPINATLYDQSFVNVAIFR
tara:strand:+ start:448 stop:828 length:381 start_codon:yes stop_codon:yes gene_type:complete